VKLLNLKVPFGTAKGVALRNVKYLQWEDAFEVDFEDGLSFLEPHATIRKANKIYEKAHVQSVELEGEFRHGFFVRYDNGQTAEVSWSFIRISMSSPSSTITPFVLLKHLSLGVLGRRRLQF
jgi:hypothetical protein